VNRVNAPDGTPLVYDEYESASPRAAVLLLPDWTDQSEQWKNLGTRLRDAGFAAYVLDQRGHGRSGGRKGHLSRFSQLLGDLQAIRRAVRRRHDLPQILWGHGFGALIALRYLETQPGEPPAAAIVSNPWLASRNRSGAWKTWAARFADLWPTLPTGSGNELMTAGARAELQWAQRAIIADRDRIERPLLFLLSGNDEVVDAPLARRFAEDLGSRAQLRWYPELPHDVLRGEAALRDALGFLTVSRSSESVRKSE
jgi:alpha-beta hydrolase superfamily lysophospholipase